MSELEIDEEDEESDEHKLEGGSPVRVSGAVGGRSGSAKSAITARDPDATSGPLLQ